MFARAATFVCCFVLLTGCYKAPSDFVADRAKGAVTGSANDTACDQAGDITRDVTQRVEDVTPGDFHTLVARMDEGATHMRRAAADAEGGVRQALTAVGDAYRDLASSVRVRDGAGISRAQSSIETATKALAAACDGKTQEG